MRLPEITAMSRPVSKGARGRIQGRMLPKNMGGLSKWFCGEHTGACGTNSFFTEFPF